MRVLSFLKDQHCWYALGVDAVCHHLGPGHACLVLAVIVHCPCLLSVLVPNEAQVVLPNKTDHACRGICRDRYLFCLPANRKDIRNAERATYRNKESKQIHRLYLLIIRVPVYSQIKNSREGRLHLGDGPKFLLFEVPALAVLTGFHIRQ